MSAIIFAGRFRLLIRKGVVAIQVGRLVVGGFAAGIISFANVALAETDNAPDWATETLSGDWGATRSSLYSQGVDLGFTHKSDVMGNVSGGIKRGAAWMGHTEARLKMNLEKLWGWNSTTAYFLYHSQLGSKFNREYVGSFVGVDNIEANVNTAQFAHAWIEKNIFGDRLSVLGGIYSIDSEFYVTETSSAFIQPPYGMANDMAQSGQNGPPIFPIGAMAVRVKYTTPGNNFYLQSALTDGVPGDPDNSYGTHIKLGNGDGTLLVAEFGYTPQESEPAQMINTEQQASEEQELFNKTAIGVWRYSTRFNDLDSANPTQHPSRGVYVLAERSLSVASKRSGRGLSGFVRFGTASKDIHQADWTGSLGLRCRGLIANRGKDISGIAVTVSHASEKYRLINDAENSQTAVEATYRAQLQPWLALQPTLQYVANPNMDKAIGNAWIVGMRLELAL